MNREIKFRVWCTDKKVLVHETDLDILKTVFHIDFMDKEIGPRQIIYNIGLYNDNSVLMQYTGLKDMNVKEIYEGDIVKKWWGINENGNIFRNHCITFFQESNKMLWKLDNLYNHWSGKDVEIIGNIFETPELLKV